MKMAKPLRWWKSVRIFSAVEDKYSLTDDFLPHWYITWSSNYEQRSFPFWWMGALYKHAPRVCICRCISAFVKSFLAESCFIWIRFFVKFCGLKTGQSGDVAWLYSTIKVCLLSMFSRSQRVFIFSYWVAWTESPVYHSSSFKRHCVNDGIVLS